MTGPCCLLVFAKVPRAGHVKTRLVPPLSHEQAADLYDAFLRDALDALAPQAEPEGESDPLGFGERVSLRLYLDQDDPGGLAPDGVDVRRQSGSGLGERMATAFAHAFADGFERIVVMGTDHPTLPLGLLGEAFRQLEEPMTCVVGPSDDGGYVFLGLNDLAPDLFAMRFSHGRVFADTIERAAEAGLQPVVLPYHYDVDDAESLSRLVAEWRDGVPVGARTARVLRTLTEA